MKKIVFLVFMAFLGLGTEGVAQSCTTTAWLDQSSASCNLPVGDYPLWSASKRSVVNIRYNNGNAEDVGTGFIVNSTSLDKNSVYVLTASHVISSAPRSSRRDRRR